MWPQEGEMAALASHSSKFDHPNKMYRIQISKLLIIHFTTSLCYFLLKLKYSQHLQFILVLE
jgi:hypothetical protein